MKFYVELRTGVGVNLRPSSMFFLWGMSPTKGKTGARDHVNLARKTNLYLKLIIFGKFLLFD